MAQNFSSGSVIAAACRVALSSCAAFAASYCPDDSSAVSRLSSKARFACDICAAAIEAHMSNIKVVIGFFIVFLAPGRRQEVWLRKGK